MDYCTSFNAGTTLKYPVKFIASQNRQVFLEEAFFDVAKIKNTLCC
jgi:hypothetical protein